MTETMDTAHDYKGFMQDFVIAEAFGEKAVKDTAKRAMDEWKGDVKYYASLVLTLNHLLWAHYEAGHEKAARLYDALWRKADGFAYRHFKGEDLAYYVRFLD